MLGSNGSGKSTFLKILLGEVALKEGSLKIRKELEFSYFDQLRNDLKDSKPIKKILLRSVITTIILTIYIILLVSITTNYI